MAAASRHHDFEERTSAEWVTLVASIVVLLVIVGGLVWIEVSRGNTPARVSVSADVDAAEEHDGQWYVPVTVTNVGDRATDTLRVAVQLGDEVSELEYQFVAGGERVAGTAVFDEQPSADALKLDVISITDP